MLQAYFAPDNEVKIGYTIHSVENETKEQEIIDGQQRITSLFLLLRAIYTKLQETPEKADKAKNFISQIEPSLWRTDKLTGKVDYQNILITSRVVNNDGNEVLRKILESYKIWNINYKNSEKKRKRIQRYCRKKELF